MSAKSQQQKPHQRLVAVPREKSSSLAEAAIERIIDRHESGADGLSFIDPAFRHEMIATAAYYMAEQRGFVPGHESDDWIAAESTVNATLARVERRESGDHRPSD